MQVSNCLHHLSDNITGVPFRIIALIQNPVKHLPTCGSARKQHTELLFLCSYELFTPCFGPFKSFTWSCRCSRRTSSSPRHTYSVQQGRGIKIMNAKPNRQVGMWQGRGGIIVLGQSESRVYFCCVSGNSSCGFSLLKSVSAWIEGNLCRQTTYARGISFLRFSCQYFAICFGTWETDGCLQMLV